MRRYDLNHPDRPTTELRSHDGAVQSTVFDNAGENLLSAGNDGTVCYWS
jgi:WD40 repeat protein